AFPLGRAGNLRNFSRRSGASRSTRTSVWSGDRHGSRNGTRAARRDGPSPAPRGTGSAASTPTIDRDLIEFARTGSAVGATAATLEKTRILGAYFRGLSSDDDLRLAATFMSGRAFAPSQRRTLGLGWRALSKTITDISER